MQAQVHNEAKENIAHPYIIEEKLKAHVQSESNSILPEQKHCNGRLHFQAKIPF